jgi:hypothetical protein
MAPGNVVGGAAIAAPDAKMAPAAKMARKTKRKQSLVRRNAFTNGNITEKTPALTSPTYRDYIE